MRHRGNNTKKVTPTSIKRLFDKNALHIEFGDISAALRVIASTISPIDIKYPTATLK